MNESVLLTEWFRDGMEQHVILAKKLTFFNAWIKSLSYRLTCVFDSWLLFSNIVPVSLLFFPPMGSNSTAATASIFKIYSVPVLRCLLLAVASRFSRDVSRDGSRVSRESLTRKFWNYMYLQANYLGQTKTRAVSVCLFAKAELFWQLCIKILTVLRALVRQSSYLQHNPLHLRQLRSPLTCCW